MGLVQFLTRSGLSYREVSSKDYHDSFCLLRCSVSLPWVIYFEAFYLHVVSSFSCIPVICPLQFVHFFCNLSQVYPAVLLMYFISASVILLASIALIVQVSLPYNTTGKASVGLNMPVQSPITHSGEILTTGKSHGKKKKKLLS